MNKNDFLLLKKLSEAFGPSGREDAVREIILDSIKGQENPIKIDGIGNLIVEKGDVSRLIITAHMDEVGFMLTGYCENGSLEFDQIGGIIPSILPSKVVSLENGRFFGVIGATPIHFQTKSKERAELHYEDLCIDFGFDDIKEAKEHVSIGDFAVFDAEFDYFDKSRHFLKGKALDNRIGCYLLIKLIQSKAVQNATFAFTVQEECGLNGAKAILQKKSFDYGIALDTTTANDLPNLSPDRRICGTDRGAVISFADGATVYRRNFIRSIMQGLESEGIPYQTKSAVVGGNEASAMEKSGEGVIPISLSVPCRYIHGPIGLVSERDIEYSQKALAKIIAVLEGNRNV